MVQFLSINFFPWISSIFVGFFKSSSFFVSPCITVRSVFTARYGLGLLNVIDYVSFSNCWISDVFLYWSGDPEFR